MSKYWFDNEEEKRVICPFKHTTKEVAYCHRLEDSNVSYKQELLDDRKALSNISSSLTSMLLDCRRKGKITLDEEDCLFLCQLAHKDIELDFSKLRGD